MKVVKQFYFELGNKKVEIYTKPIGTNIQEKYVGTI